jgi:hypothetical protein
MSIEARIQRLEASSAFRGRNDRMTFALISDTQTLVEQKDEIEKARAAADVPLDNVLIVRFVGSDGEGHLRNPRGHA